ncbi:MAG: poly-gamma-glutamate hydrolase family protein, partial [Gemmatimonadota bacterium]
DRHFVMVGGLWIFFRDRFAGVLEEAGFPVESPRKGLGGVHPTNICNRGRSGTGAQLEISGGLRRTLRKDPEELRRFVELVRETLFQAEREEMAHPPSPWGPISIG